MGQYDIACYEGEFPVGPHQSVNTRHHGIADQGRAPGFRVSWFDLARCAYRDMAEISKIPGILPGQLFNQLSYRGVDLGQRVCMLDGLGQ